MSISPTQNKQLIIIIIIIARKKKLMGSFSSIYLLEEVLQGSMSLAPKINLWQTQNVKGLMKNKNNLLLDQNKLNQKPMFYESISQ